MLRSEFDSLCSDDLDARRWFDTRSARSPVHLVQDAGHSAHALVTLESFHESLGRRIGEPVELIWGDERNPDGGTSAATKRIRRLLANEHWTDSFRLTEEQMLAVLERLARHPPKLVVAYAPAIYELARFAERNAIPVRPQRAIVTAPGTLDDSMRTAIERVFKCEAFNEYLSGEVGPVALECDAHQLRDAAHPVRDRRRRLAGARGHLYLRQGVPATDNPPRAHRSLPVPRA
jgi:phenylacetate-CoA ligase